MIIVPQTLATEVGDALNALIKESDRFRNWDDAEVQTVLPAIKKLQKVDAREAFVRFGSLAAICGNVDDMFAYYHKALLLPGEVETKHEFFASLGNAGLYSKAQEIAVGCSIQGGVFSPKCGSEPSAWAKSLRYGIVCLTRRRHILTCLRSISRS